MYVLLHIVSSVNGVSQPFFYNWHFPSRPALCPVPCQRGRQWRHGKSPHGGPSHPAAEDLQISGDLTHSCRHFCLQIDRFNDWDQAFWIRWWKYDSMLWIYVNLCVAWKFFYSTSHSQRFNKRSCSKSFFRDSTLRTELQPCHLTNCQS